MSLTYISKIIVALVVPKATGVLLLMAMNIDPFQLTSVFSLYRIERIAGDEAVFFQSVGTDCSVHAIDVDAGSRVGIGIGVGLEYTCDATTDVFLGVRSHK
jgi:hypothetical protein